ncbi:MAG: hypothetical protein PHE53_03200 [Thermoguttaceae bacterium]|nr:hypothetical protein [Thermoguttaceae bacterium]
MDALSLAAKWELESRQQLVEALIQQAKENAAKIQLNAENYAKRARNETYQGRMPTLAETTREVERQKSIALAVVHEAEERRQQADALVRQAKRDATALKRSAETYIEQMKEDADREIS